MTGEIASKGKRLAINADEWNSVRRLAEKSGFDGAQKGRKGYCYPLYEGDAGDVFVSSSVSIPAGSILYMTAKTEAELPPADICRSFINDARKTSVSEIDFSAYKEPRFCQTLQPFDVEKGQRQRIYCKTSGAVVADIAGEYFPVTGYKRLFPGTDGKMHSTGEVIAASNHVSLGIIPSFVLSGNTKCAFDLAKISSIHASSYINDQKDGVVLKTSGEQAEIFVYFDRVTITGQNISSERFSFHDDISAIHFLSQPSRSSFIEGEVFEHTARYGQNAGIYCKIRIYGFVLYGSIYFTGWEILEKNTTEYIDAR